MNFAKVSSLFNPLTIQVTGYSPLAQHFASFNLIPPQFFHNGALSYFEFSHEGEILLPDECGSPILFFLNSQFKKMHCKNPCFILPKDIKIRERLMTRIRNNSKLYNWYNEVVIFTNEYNQCLQELASQGTLTVVPVITCGCKVSLIIFYDTTIQHDYFGIFIQPTSFGYTYTYIDTTILNPLFFYIIIPIEGINWRRFSF